MIRKILWLLATLHLAHVHLAEAQQPKKVPQLGVISGGSASTDAAYHESFLQGLRELGRIKGQKYSY